MIVLRLARVACAGCGWSIEPKGAAPPWLCHQCSAWAAVGAARRAGDADALAAATQKLRRMMKAQGMEVGKVLRLTRRIDPIR